MHYRVRLTHKLLLSIRKKNGPQIQRMVGTVSSGLKSCIGVSNSLQLVVDLFVEAPGGPTVHIIHSLLEPEYFYTNFAFRTGSFTPPKPEFEIRGLEVFIIPEIDKMLVDNPHSLQLALSLCSSYPSKFAFVT